MADEKEGAFLRIPAKDLPASPRQRELMRFIHYYWIAHGQGPTIKEMGIAISRNPATARHHLMKLIDKKMLEHRIAKQRGWELTAKGQEEIKPFLGVEYDYSKSEK